MGLSSSYKQKNYMGEYADDASVLTFIRANKWDSVGNGTGDPREGMLYYNTAIDTLKVYANGSWNILLNTGYVSGSNIKTGVSEITGTSIDWPIAQYHYKSITNNTALTFSNDDNGYQITTIITNTGAAKYDVTFPAGIKWPGGTPFTKVTSGRSNIYTFVKVNNVIYGTYIIDLF
jgi:hypothetical protein